MRIGRRMEKSHLKIGDNDEDPPTKEVQQSTSDPESGFVSQRRAQEGFCLCHPRQLVIRMAGC
jgi:hypothetical protein